jgi:hypothetical protein
VWGGAPTIITYSRPLVTRFGARTKGHTGFAQTIQHVPDAPPDAPDYWQSAPAAFVSDVQYGREQESQEDCNNRKNYQQGL